MKEEKEEAASVGKRVQYECYDEIFKKKARVMFNLPEDIPLKERCLQRVNRKNRNVVVAQ
jgi:hypothetical protein